MASDDFQRDWGLTATGPVMSLTSGNRHRALTRHQMVRVSKGYGFIVPDNGARTFSCT